MDTYTGIVQKGSKRAAALGYPTINIPLEDTSVSGIYVALVKVGEEKFEAVAYADQKRKLLEAHILDFPSEGGSASGGSIDLYSWNVKVELLKKIRGHKKFTSDVALKKAIGGDITAVRTYFMKKG